MRNLLAVLALAVSLTACSPTEPAPCATGCAVEPASQEEAMGWAAWDAQEGWRHLSTPPEDGTHWQVQVTEYATAPIKATDGSLVLVDSKARYFRYSVTPMTMDD